MIVYDDSVKTRRPVIFMQPDWKGVDADTIAVARTVAGQDYVVLLADMFAPATAASPRRSRSWRPVCAPCSKDLRFHHRLRQPGP